MFEYTLDFFKFLHNCEKYHIRLRSIKVFEDEHVIRFHFAKQYFKGNNSFFFDDDYYLQLNSLCFDNERALYEVLIDEVCKRYNIKY